MNNQKNQISVSEINNFPSLELSKEERKALPLGQKMAFINSLCEKMYYYKGFQNTDLHINDSTKGRINAYNAAVDVSGRTMYFENIAFMKALKAAYENFDPAEERKFYTYFESIYRNEMANVLAEEKRQQDKAAGNRPMTRKDKEDYKYLLQVAKELYGATELNKLSYKQIEELHNQTDISRKQIERFVAVKAYGVSLDEGFENDDGKEKSNHSIYGDESSDLSKIEDQLDARNALENLEGGTGIEKLAQTASIINRVSGDMAEFEGVLTQQLFDKMVDVDFAAAVYEVEKEKITPKFILSTPCRSIGEADIARYRGCSKANITQQFNKKNLSIYKRSSERKNTK